VLVDFRNKAGEFLRIQESSEEREESMSDKPLMMTL
jgi:hypothetical protein